MFDNFLINLFEKYAELLKRRFSDDFQEVCHWVDMNFYPREKFSKLMTSAKIVSTDDYMPMPIQNIEEYDKVLNVSWYNPEKSREQQT